MSIISDNRIRSEADITRIAKLLLELAISEREAIN